MIKNFLTKNKNQNKEKQRKKDKPKKPPNNQHFEM